MCPACFPLRTPSRRREDGSVGSGRARWRNDGLALRRSPRGEGPIRQEGLRIRDALRTARAYLHIKPPSRYVLSHETLQSKRKDSFRFLTCWCEDGMHLPFAHAVTHTASSFSCSLACHHPERQTGGVHLNSRNMAAFSLMQGVDGTSVCCARPYPVGAGVCSQIGMSHIWHRTSQHLYGR